MRSIDIYIGEKLVINKDSIKHNDTIAAKLISIMEDYIADSLGINPVLFNIKIEQDEKYLKTHIYFKCDKWFLDKNYILLKQHIRDNNIDSDLGLEIVDAWTDEATNRMFFKFKIQK